MNDGNTITKTEIANLANAYNANQIYADDGLERVKGISICK